MVEKHPLARQSDSRLDPCTDMLQISSLERKKLSGRKGRGRFHSQQRQKNKQQLLAQNEFLARRFPSITPAMIDDQKRRRISRPKLGSSLGIKQNRLAEKVNFRSKSGSPDENNVVRRLLC